MTDANEINWVPVSCIRCAYQMEGDGDALAEGKIIRCPQCTNKMESLLEPIEGE